MAKRQLTAWVSEATFTTLQSRAKTEGADLSPLTADILDRAIADGVQGSVRYAPVVKAFGATVTDAMSEEVNFIADCASKTALYALAARFELRRLLAKRLGEEAARAVAQEAWRKAVEELRKPPEGEM